MVASKKTLKAAAHDIAHHAQSGLSFLYPHLWKACRAVGVSRAAVELVAENPFPSELPRAPRLESAFRALSSRFVDVVEGYGHRMDDVSSVILTFTFPSELGDGSVYAVTSRVKAYGQIYVATLPIIGRKYTDPRLRKPHREA